MSSPPVAAGRRHCRWWHDRFALIKGNGVGLRCTLQESRDEQTWLDLAGGPYVSIDFSGASFGPVNDGCQLGFGGFARVRVHYLLDVIAGAAPPVPGGGSVLVTASLAVPNPRRSVR